MRRLFALLLILGLLLASTVAAADQGRGRGRGGPFGVVGAFELQAETSSAMGEHVAFTYGESGITDFRAGDRILFDLTVRGDGDENDGRGERLGSQGAQLRVRMPNFTFVAHDAPTAASRLETDGMAQLVFEEGVVLARENGESVRFSFGTVTGAIRGDDIAMSGRTLTIDDGMLFILDAPRGPFDGHHRDLGRAIAKGHIGAEATLNLAEDETVVDEVVSYANVTMTTLKAERGNITVAIDGHGFEGRVVVLNVDGRVLGAESADKLNILIDNETVRPASSMTDILDPDDDGFHPEYYIVFDPQAEAFQLLVTLPHYSVHILSVTTTLVLPPPSVVIGVVAGLALLVPTAVVLFRRK